jgi:hypothetical protein
MGICLTGDEINCHLFRYSSSMVLEYSVWLATVPNVALLRMVPYLGPAQSVPFCRGTLPQAILPDALILVAKISRISSPYAQTVLEVLNDGLLRYCLQRESQRILFAGYNRLQVHSEISTAK